MGAVAAVGALCTVCFEEPGEAAGRFDVGQTLIAAEIEKRAIGVDRRFVAADQDGERQTLEHGHCGVTSWRELRLAVGGRRWALIFGWCGRGRRVGHPFANGSGDFVECLVLALGKSL